MINPVFILVKRWVGLLLARLHGGGNREGPSPALALGTGGLLTTGFYLFCFVFLFFFSFPPFPPPPSLSSLCLVSLQTSGEKKRSGHTASNGFAGHINLPDLVQQSHSPAGTPTEALGRVSTHAQDMDSVPEVGGGGAPLSPFALL